MSAFLFLLSFQDDIDFFGLCSTLEPPWTRQQPWPDPVSDFSLVHPHQTQKKHRNHHYIHPDNQCGHSAHFRALHLPEHVLTYKQKHRDCEFVDPEGKNHMKFKCRPITAERSESKWASALHRECLASSCVREQANKQTKKLYRSFSSWCYEAFVCKVVKFEVWRKVSKLIMLHIEDNLDNMEQVKMRNV